MAVSTKTLFLGVYTSNGLIRVAFIPVCYLILLSPFTLLFARHYRLDQAVVAHIPKNYRTPDTLPQVFAAFVTVALFTRLLTGSRFGNGAKNNGGKRRVQLLPYWIPRARHWGDIVFGGEAWLKGIGESSTMNIVAYNPAGSKHNLILSAALLDRIAANSKSLIEAESTKWITPSHAAGLPNGSKAQYLQLQPEICKILDLELFKGQGLKTMIASSLRTLSDSLPDLITFNSSMVDQLPWERVSGLELTDGTDEAECDLFTLINEFFSSAILPSITGQQFPESYQLLASDLATFDQSYFALALGFPRFFPLPGLPGASLARTRLLGNLKTFLNDLTYPPERKIIADDESQSGEEDNDADTPTPLTALNDFFTQNNFPMQARAAIALHIIQNIVSQAVPLAFWTIYHIYAASSSIPGTTLKGGDTPLYKIRQETNDWAAARQPPSIHPSFPAPPEISFASTNALLSPTKFTYLRSCIFEARRIYSSSIISAQISKPIIFTEPGARPGAEENWQLDVGSYVDIGLSQRIINTSSANYIDPHIYKPDRYANVQSPDPLASSLFDESNELTTALVVAFIAGVTQLWEISAAPKKSFFEQMQEAQAAASGQPQANQESTQRKVGVWQLPRVVDGARVKVPKGEVRVRIRRREALEASKPLRR